MTLLLDAGVHSVGSCAVRDGHLTPSTIDTGADWGALLPDAGHESVDVVAYLLRHGGAEVTEPVVPLEGTGQDLLLSRVPFLPRHNALTRNLIAFWRNQAPDARHLLLCDTAFFHDLPPESAYYAVPWELQAFGVRRFGTDGLLHEWIWNQLAKRSDHYHRVLSVHLADESNVVAIRDGRPVETTSGFAPVEGLPSATGCGDIDPTLILELQTAGSSLAEMNQLLSTESGFGALLGRSCGYSDLVSIENDKPTAAVRRAFRYALQKAIGSATAAMGGVDAITFSGAPLRGTMDLATELCIELAQAGVETGFPAAEGCMTRISGPGSFVQVFCCSPNRWRIMTDTISANLAREQSRG